MAAEQGLDAVTRPAPLDVHAVHPLTEGWAGAAMAIHAVQRRPDSMYLRLDVSGHGLLSIDFRHHAYDWGTPLELVPERPATVLVETHPTFPGAPALFALPGRDLDPLLWIIGRAAFGDAPAPWLEAGRRYRLARWPGLSELSITLDQVRMTSMLGNGFATAHELAAAAGVTPAEAQRTMNAYALLDILRAAPDAPSSPAPVAAESATRRGLFARLRSRLGGGR